MALIPAALTGARHPLDPDPVRSTKAAAVLALGIVAALTGFFLGGLVPATLALLLARQAHREQLAAAGFLTGGRALRIGVRPADLLHVELFPRVLAQPEPVPGHQGTGVAGDDVRQLQE